MYKLTRPFASSNLAIKSERFVLPPGTRFGRLRIVGPAFRITSLWRVVVECECGAVKVNELFGLTRGNTKSCGCLQRELSSNRQYKHGMDGKRPYRIWVNMRKRCANPRNNRYERYGGRGIQVCEAWSDFDTFWQWARDNGYADNLTIDRINNDGDYEPSNCRWATPKEQGRNRSSNRLLTINGKTMCISAWAEHFGVTRKEVVAMSKSELCGA